MSQFSRKDQQEQDPNHDKPSEIKSTSSTSSTGETIVTPDPTNFDIKHPLQNKWTMWYNAPPTKKVNSTSWKQDVKHNKITDFDTVEDFWCLFNNLSKPSELADKSNYLLMKEGIVPEWESAKDGGCWRVVPQKENMQEMNKLWLWMVLAVIGESFDDGNDIMGAVIFVRARGTKLELWTKHSSDSVICLRIGNQLKTALELGNQQLIYLTFDDQIARKDTPKYEL